MTEWIKLRHSNLRHQFTPPILLNNNEMILSSNTHIYDPKYHPGIYKYNIKEEEASLFMAYSELGLEDSFILRDHTMALDKDKQILYLLDGAGCFLIFDLKQKRGEYIKTNIEIGIYPASWCINGEFHIFGGRKSNKHFIWNTESNKFHFKQQISCFNETVYAPALIYIEWQKLVYLFGGLDGYDAVNTICSYSIIDEIWKKHEIELPSYFNLCTPGCVTTTFDEKYIIIFDHDCKHNGGYIYYMDLNEMQIIQSKVRLPSGDENEDYEGFYAVTVSNLNHSDLLISGYIAKYSSSIVPIEINSLILKWFRMQYIYVFDEDCSISPKWKIAVDDIFK